MRRRNIGFTCKESWALGHICAAGKAHYIEVFSDDEEDEEEEPEGGHSVVIVGDYPPPPRGGSGSFAPIGGALA